MNADPTPLTPSRLNPLLQPVYAFLSAESAGGIVLLISTVAALLWANSPWGDSYAHFWHLPFSIGVGSFSYVMSLEHWVNDGLMVIFFLLVGLEIKRELLLGELASVQRAALPVAAAIGGMVVPALIYAGFNHGGAGARGWGVPMATDIAFAVGVLALVGRSVPISIKVLLLAIAIVDDLGAVLVIAIFYTNEISTIALGIAGGFFAALVLLNVLRVHHPLPYILLGVGLWVATLASGIHATIAGVLLAFTIPASRQIEERPFAAFMKEQLTIFERNSAIEPDRITHDQSHAIKSMEEASQAVQTTLAIVEHALLKPVNFLIIPLFVLANAGVEVGSGIARHGIASAMSNSVTWGVLMGLFVGKPLGVLLASWAAIRLRIASLPEGATHRQLFGVAVLCGIGFTMSLFVANLAFPVSPEQLTAAKAGILAASLLAGVTGGWIIAWSGKRMNRIAHA